MFSTLLVSLVLSVHPVVWAYNGCAGVYVGDADASPDLADYGVASCNGDYVDVYTASGNVFSTRGNG